MDASISCVCSTDATTSAPRLWSNVLRRAHRMRQSTWRRNTALSPRRRNPRIAESLLWLSRWTCHRMRSCKTRVDGFRYTNERFLADVLSNNVQTDMSLNICFARFSLGHGQSSSPFHTMRSRQTVGVCLSSNCLFDRVGWSPSTCRSTTSRCTRQSSARLSPKLLRRVVTTQSHSCSWTWTSLKAKQATRST